MFLLHFCVPLTFDTDGWIWRDSLSVANIPHLSFPLSEALEEELLGHQPPPLLHGALLRGEPNHITNILLTFNKLQLACHDVDFFFPTDGDRPRSFPESCGRQPAISCYVVCGIKLRCFPSLLAMPACMQSTAKKKLIEMNFPFPFSLM